MIQRLKKIFVVLLFVIILLSGCSIQGGKTQEYYSSAKDFNDIYFKVVKQIEINNDKKSLESLQTEENRLNIERLGMLLENIKQIVPKDREVHYDNFKERYEDLVFLKESYPRFNELTEKERARIDRAMVMINYYKDDRNDKNSKTIWE